MIKPFWKGLHTPAFHARGWLSVVLAPVGLTVATAMAAAEPTPVLSLKVLSVDASADRAAIRVNGKVHVLTRHESVDGLTLIRTSPDVWLEYVDARGQRHAVRMEAGDSRSLPLDRSPQGPTPVVTPVPSPETR